MKLVKDQLWFPDDDLHMAKEYESGATQLDTFELAVSFCKTFDLAVDGGAHVGIWSIAMSYFFTEVLSFEPAKETYKCLTKNTEAFPNIHTYQKGLYSTNRTFSLAQDTRHAGNTGGNYIIPGNDYTTILLDQLNLSKCSILKLDTEGTELFALLGARKTIEQFSPVIVCEEKSKLMARQGVNEYGVRSFLSELGYKIAAKRRKDFIYVK